MFFKFLPHEVCFFDLFDKQVDQAMEAANYFKELVMKGSVDQESISKISAIEHRGDDVAHEIFGHLNKTFITPFDREDIHALAKELDNITDMINTIAGRMRVYKLKPADKNLIEFASVIEKSVCAVAQAVKALRNMKDPKAIHEACVEVNRLENVGDALRDASLADLFENNTDAIVVLKWKEIYQDAETVLDICEDVTHVVEAIILKQT